MNKINSKNSENVIDFQTAGGILTSMNERYVESTGWAYKIFILKGIHDANITMA